MELSKVSVCEGNPLSDSSGPDVGNPDCASSWFVSPKKECESVAVRLVSSGGIEVSIDGKAGTDESKAGSEVSNEGRVVSIWGSVVSIAGRVESIGGRDVSILGRVESIAGDSLVAAVVDVVVVGALVAVASVASKFSESVDGCAESAGGLVSLLSAIFTHSRETFRAHELSVLGQWMKIGVAISVIGTAAVDRFFCLGCSSLRGQESHEG